MGKLDGKAAVITGAASGMGRASALLFAQEGARLLLADVDAKGGEAVADEIARAGGRAIFRRVDVSQPEQVEAMIGAAVTELGALDVLFNNAGIEGESARLADSSLANWDRVLAINLKGVFLGMKYALPVMIERGGGSIINTASVAGLVGWHGAGAYSASKGGVVILTKTAALEYARWNIRVNCICPGVIHTPMVERITHGRADMLERLKQAQPLPRIGTPEDIAQMALYLASDDAAFVTGAAMVVDGGYTAR
jgi:NAD(P)-dependent dehydrogenase (short-subunit alcohol dehydrogenase family)